MRMVFTFKSFRTRIVAFFLGLLVLVQVTGFLLVNAANTRNARDQIDAALEDTAEAFHQLLDERTQSLLVAARLLSGDFAFKTAYSTGEHGTVLSALENHQQRIGADSMLLVSMENEILADTLHPKLHHRPFAYPTLTEAASEHEYGEAAAIVLVDDRPYQMVLVPLLTPTPDAWICIGFLLDNRMAQGLMKISSSHVSFLKQQSEKRWKTVATTLPATLGGALAEAVGQNLWRSRVSTVINLGGNDFVSLVTRLGQSSPKVVAVLQRSLDAALEPLKKLRYLLLALFVGALALSFLGALLIARGITQPVLKLAQGAQRVRDGNYNQPVAVVQRDEIGELGTSFNHMMDGLAERDRVRDLLGKVVSSAIAEELMSKDVELGGEEKEVTILFSDIRNFTALCEGRSPKEILGFLNTYLTRISDVIEAEGGVVDKYIGDAVMALFGAPLEHADDATRALRAAMGICRAFKALNEELKDTGCPKLAIGIGINTAVVVAGNMGSLTRLNYTVIGDGVNLASRLEGLTKKYGVPIVISKETRKAAPEFVCREIDLVCVKGKTEPVAIYQPIGRIGEVGSETEQELAQYQGCLQLYRQQQWDDAIECFTRLSRNHPEDGLYRLYVERLELFKANPPPNGWNGVFAFNEK